MAIASTHKRSVRNRQSAKPGEGKGLLRSLSVKLGMRRHERTGLLVAAAAHVALALLLVASPPRQRIVLPPERIAVTLGEMVPVSQAPSPSPSSSASSLPAPATPLVAPPAPPPEPPAQSKGLPAPVSPTLAKPPIPRPIATPTSRPSATPSIKPAAKPTSSSSRIGSDFLKDLPKTSPGGTAGSRASTSAIAIGPAVQSALSAAISRKLKPRWVAPQGVDAEKLVTILSFDLKRDGSLSGTPRMVRQEGITAANRPQAQRHFEQAVRAVQLAAPFTLPSEYYDAWKHVASFRFDKRLSQ